jgi:hypothetical protein
MVKNNLVHGGMNKIIDLLGNIEDHHNKRDKGNGKDEGAQELFKYIPVDGF